MTNELQRPVGFDSPSLVEQNDDPVFPWITRRDLGYWIQDPKLDALLQFFAGHYLGYIRHWGYSPVRRKVTVLAGFPTDFASVPRWAWSIVSRDEIRRPAVLHDAFYRAAKLIKRMGWFTRRELRRWRLLFDRIFLEAMQYCEPRIPEWKRWLVYRAVRIGGRI